MLYDRETSTTVAAEPLFDPIHQAYQERYGSPVEDGQIDDPEGDAGL